MPHRSYLKSGVTPVALTGSGLIYDTPEIPDGGVRGPSFVLRSSAGRAPSQRCSEQRGLKSS